MLRRLCLKHAVVFLVAAASGCGTSYVTPGAGVAPASLAAGESAEWAKPAATFPARIAVARVQATGYYNPNVAGYGGGRFSVVTQREVESDADFARLSALPQVSGVAVLNRMILPSHLSSDADLREAARKLKTDLLLLYSFDTTFNVRDHDVGPLALLTLGNLPNQEATVYSTCSAALFDARTGFVYGLAEGSARESRRASVWRKQTAIDASRQAAETKSFAALVPEIARLWSGVLAEHAARPTSSPVGRAKND